MVLLSTLLPAIIMVALMQFFVIRLLPWRWLSYGLSLATAVALVSTGKVHFSYTGLEVAGLGCLVTWLDPLGYWKKNP